MNRRDAAILHILKNHKLKTIPDAIAMMRKMETRLRPTKSIPMDGIWAFTHVYHLVTQAIWSETRHHAWQSEAWLKALDVSFSKLYFSALKTWLTRPRQTPPAWLPLFENRFNTKILPVEFVLAGMNAHINRDLPIALVKAFQSCRSEPKNSSKEHQDFDHVNAVLSRVETQAVLDLATGWIKTLSDATAPFDGKVIMAFVTGARNQAWRDAKKLWKVRADKIATKSFITKLDWVTEKLGKSIV